MDAASESHPLRSFSAFVVALAAFVVLPALWSFGSAVVSPVSTGEVLVIRVGRYETYRAMVPWTEGWARFVAPPVLVVACVVCAGPQFTRKWWFGAALAAVGVSLLLFSAWFTTLRGAKGFGLLSAFVASSYFVDHWLGRRAAFAFMLTTVLVAVFLYAPR